MPTGSKTKKPNNKQPTDSLPDVGSDDLTDLSEVSSMLAEKTHMSDSDKMTLFYLVLIGGSILVAIISIIAAVINGANYVPRPEIVIKNDTVNADFGKNNKIVIKDKNTDIEMEFGDGDKTCSKENEFELTINDEKIEGLPDYCKTYVIKNSDIPTGETEYTIRVKNKSGSDVFFLYVDNTYAEESKETNTSKYPMTSSGMDLPTAAHVNCRSYANRYFYPNKVELNNILDGGDYDYRVDDGWLWKPIAWVTSSAGGKVAYQAVCKTDLDGHVTSFYTWE